MKLNAAHHLDSNEEDIFSRNNKLR